MNTKDTADRKQSPDPVKVQGTIVRNNSAKVVAERGWEENHSETLVRSR